MSNEVVVAHPRGKWSGPVYMREAEVLHRRYATYCGEIKKSMILLVARLQSASFMNVLDAPLSDGYAPLSCVVFRVPRGRIAIMFPKFSDRHLLHGTTTDRAVTIHTAGAIDTDDVIAVVDMFLMHLPPARPPGYGGEWPTRSDSPKDVGTVWPDVFVPKTCRATERV